MTVAVVDGDCAKAVVTSAAKPRTENFIVPSASSDSILDSVETQTKVIMYVK